MAFWDDLIKNISGQSNAPQQKSSGALRKAAPAISRNQVFKPTALSGGGGGGGMRSFSAPAPHNDAPARSGRSGGVSFGTAQPAPNPLGEFGNLLHDMFSVKEVEPGLAQNIRDKKDEVDATWSTNRDVGDRLPEMWNNTPLEGLARPLVAFDETNSNDIAALQAAKKPTRDELAATISGGQDLGVRELTPEEWDKLDLATQQAITANYALYEATQADRALEPGERVEGYDDTVSAIFGTEGGSDTYAPNTIRVLAELGYANPDNDLDYFLNGGAILTEDELLNKGLRNEGRMGILEELQNSSTWDNSNLVPMLEEGTSLIESLRQGDALSADTLRLAGIQPLAMYDIDPERMDALNGLMQGMASRDVWNAFSQDAEVSNSFKKDFDSITNGLDPALVSQYFRESYPQYFENAAYGDSNSYMTPDEFFNTWLN